MSEELIDKINAKGGIVMAPISESIERNHKTIISSLVFAVLFMATSCIVHDVIPICHKIFGCDHKVHVMKSN
jgi:hypothetical protein